MKLTLNKIRQSGDLAWEYHPFHNIVEEDGQLSDFETDALDIDLKHPLSIECQPSYDGTVNLIINDDKNPPRIINSRFTKVEDNRYRVITRNQKEQTNLYQRDKLDSQTRLFRTLSKQPKLRLSNVVYHGQLFGGTYTFYAKFADNDFNKTDIVCESGPITVYKGTITNPTTISGTLANERTDKSIKLSLSNIDTSFSKVYLYYVRETSDINGFRVTHTMALNEPYDIIDDSMTLTINGFEDTTELTEEELNIQYMYVDTVKTQAQVQNRLFFGNVTEPTPANTELQNASLFIEVALRQGDTIGNLTTTYNNTSPSLSKTEYYNPNNLYYKLGYWPEEIYRLGIVYIMNNDELTPVYNLRGCEFDNVNDVNFDYASEGDYTHLLDYDKLDYNGKPSIVYMPKTDFITKSTLDNTMGVFKNPRANVIQEDGVKPLFYEMRLSDDVVSVLKKNKIKGFFFVRQKRIPTILGQGLELGINKNSYLPMFYDSNTDKYCIERFLSDDRLLTTTLNSRLSKFGKSDRQSSALLSLDAAVMPTLQSQFDSSEFTLSEAYKTKTIRDGRHYSYKIKEGEVATANKEARVVYTPSETTVKAIDDYAFRTQAGSAYDTSSFVFLNKESRKEFTRKDPAITRGIYTGYLGTTTKLNPGSIYNIKITNYNVTYLKDYFNIRGNDNAPFYAISDRYDFEDLKDRKLDVYRGDCYVNTVTMRLNRNFTDPDVPIDDIIVDEETWKNHYKGYYGALFVNKKDITEDRTATALEKIAKKLTKDKSSDDEDDSKTQFYKMNRADINAVPMGVWITYKCLSNYNLALRSEDTTHVDEMARMGNARTFYPLNTLSTKSSYKIPEAEVLNDGYSSTTGKKRNPIYKDLPYVKDQFDNRIMFSNVQVNDDFKNAYRIFQGLSYQDIDRQYGAIVKLIPWGANLLCVFEHGVATVPVNEKALLSTTTGQSIHMYGAGVLQQQVTVHSPDFGSTWPESIIRTPIGVYGVDTDAKKIWRFTPNKGVETISDMHVQRFLNDNLDLEELDKYPIISLLNVKTHYNNYKGDVMFTFYNYETGKEWNLCYNERADLWVTRYTWTPLYSENINNIFWSFDKKRAEVLACIYNNKNTDRGLRTSNNTLYTYEYATDLSLEGYDLAEDFTVDVLEVKSSKLVDSQEVIQYYDPSIVKINGHHLSIDNASIGALYYTIRVRVTPIVNGGATKAFETVIGAVSDVSTEETDKLLRNAFYVHGRAGKFDEIDYRDASFSNQILPTKWYDKQEPFEYEFVVNGELGLHKIFNDLVIISNNVQPSEIEYEITGDVYNFNKAGIFRSKEFGENEFDYTKEERSSSGLYKKSQVFLNTDVKWDHVTNSYSLLVHQPMVARTDPNIIQANIRYKEDCFNVVIDPIKHTNKYFINNEVLEGTDINATRLRDKTAKIRVKYSGKDLAIITAIRTMTTISYA